MKSEIFVILQVNEVEYTRKKERVKFFEFYP